MVTGLGALRHVNPSTTTLFSWEETSSYEMLRTTYYLILQLWVQIPRYGRHYNINHMDCSHALRTPAWCSLARLSHPSL